MNPVADSTGKTESGILDGNGFFEGRAPLCLRANERLSDDEIVMTPHYCRAATWFAAAGEPIDAALDAVTSTWNDTDSVPALNRTDWVCTQCSLVLWLMFPKRITGSVVKNLRV